MTGYIGKRLPDIQIFGSISTNRRHVRTPFLPPSHTTTVPVDPAYETCRYCAALSIWKLLVVPR